jgi:mRNA-degrading endonuclease RelE of RelBE toxin-antitoxin system
MPKKIYVLLKGDAKDSYLLLKKSKDPFSKSILKSIDHNISLLKENPMLGKPYPKKLIPAKLIFKYDIDNLYRIELSNFWRLLYTIQGNEIEIILLVLKIIDHKEYNKLHGY